MYNLINLIFPNICGFCKRISKYNICPKCRYSIKKIEEAKITKIKGKYFEEFAYLFKYEGIIRHMLIDYKFNEAGYLYKGLAESLINNKKIASFIKKYDIIIPVPVHKKRKRQRGYDQTELIAKIISKELGIDIDTNSLIKEKNTKPQSSLNKVDRVKNVKNVYGLKNTDKIKYKKVLLIDDIYTTGNTVNECARVIKAANVIKVGVLTLAKD